MEQLVRNDYDEYHHFLNSEFRIQKIRLMYFCIFHKSQKNNQIMADIKNKVLIIDDSSVHNVVLEGILEEEGYEIQFFNSNDPIEKIEQDLPAIILLDIMMPGRNGFDVLRNLKSNNRTMEIPVIMISAKSETDDITKAIDLGAIDYIFKPVASKRLIDKIKQYINKKI